MRTSFDDENIERELDISRQPAEETTWCAPDGLMLDLMVPPTVYPPGEDTGILCDALMHLGPGNGRSLLEIGCGSGAVSLWAATRGFKVHTCDINPLAVAALRGRADEMGLSQRIDVVEGGPGEGNIQSWAQGRHDVIIWNPPYLDPPKEGEPVLGPLEEAGMVDLDWAEGSGVILLDAIAEGNLLCDDGVVLIIRSSTTIGRHLGDEAIARGWAQRSAIAITFDDGEHLEVLAFWRPWGNRAIEQVGVVSSTNSLLLQQGGAAGRCMQALQQSAGRGQGGNTWESQEGDLLASWIVESSSPGLLQLSAGVAVMQALDSLALQDDSLADHWMKWPNDVWYGDSKVSGTLAEGRSQGEEHRQVIGIGLNLTSSIDYKHIRAENREIMSRLDAALAGLLEKKQGVPDIKDSEVISLAWSMMSRGLSKGISRARGLTGEGHLILEDGSILNETSTDWLL